MFGHEAEFDNLLETSRHLEVSQVVHKAFISVNEDGTEAGAATGKIFNLILVEFS